MTGWTPYCSGCRSESFFGGVKSKMRKSAVCFCSLCLLAMLMVLNSCSSVSDLGADVEFVDLSAGKHYSGVLEQKKAPKGILYSGFRILAMPGSDWVAPMRFQSARKAVWGMGDTKNRLHTVIAEIKISEPLSRELLADFSMPFLKQAMRRSLARSSKRVKMKSFDVWSGERCGRECVEYKAESLDTGSRHAKKGLKLFMRGFMVLTGENRILSAVVSERTDQADATQNLSAAETFLDQIRFPEGEELTGKKQRIRL